MKIIYLDTETTGLPFDRKTKEETNDRIIQLGFLLADKNGIEVYEDLSNPKVEINFHAMATHHITPEMIEDKPELKETKAYKKLEEENKEKNILIIQNSKFDLEMLRREGFELNYTLIDTLIVARHLLPEEESHSLQYLRYKLGLYKTETEAAKKLNIELKAHDAIGDVLFMKMLFEKLIEIAKEKYKLKTKKELLNKLVELTKTPVKIKTMKFGKYEGENLGNIIKKDKGYISWLLNNSDDEDLIYSIKEEQKLIEKENKKSKNKNEM